MKSFARWIARTILRLVAIVTVAGGEFEPESGPALAASNHLGRLDPVLPVVFLKRTDITLMAADKYKKYAIFRWFARQLDAIWVDRFNADLNAMRAALGRIKRGDLVILAPEGTRSKTEALLEARAGISYLAAKTGVPVIPVAITGTEDRLVVQNLKRLRRSPVFVRVGPPFTLPPLKGPDREAELKRGTDEIMCRIAAMLPFEKRGVYANHPRTLELIEAGYPDALPAEDNRQGLPSA